MIGRALGKHRRLISDSVYSLMGLVLMNAVAQIVVFPLYARKFGNVGYGDLQYLMAYVNVLAVSIGSAANYARMVSPRAEREGNAGDYNVLLVLVSLIGLPFTYLVWRFGGAPMDKSTTVCYFLLFVAMTFRYYADVAYKITLRYRSYFVYYAVIAVGYGIGAILVSKTGIWPLGLLVGEALGVVYAYLTSGLLHRRGLTLSPAWRSTLRAVLILFLSEGVANLILNVDRILLKLLIGASAVTVYYLATLVGKVMAVVAAPLNGVLIGYLTRYEGKFTRRAMRYLALGSLAAVAILTGLCTLGGIVALWLLYPTELASVKEFLWLGSLAQVLYVVSGVVMVVLIRFAKKSYQVAINAVFGVCFFGLGISATLTFDLWGFAVAMVIACAVRFLLAILLGYRVALRSDTGE